MKNTLFSFLFLLALLPLNAQSVTDEAGGIDTEFNFISEENKLDVTAQILIQRGYARSNSSSTYEENAAYGYAYGMQVYFLEVLFKGEFAAIDQNRFKKRVYLIEFLDENDEIIYSIERNPGLITYTGGETSVLQINLSGIPLLILDFTTTIQIKAVS